MGLENPPENAHGDDKRKSSKPLMEKRRRARINQSLNELKNLILEAMKKDVSCYSKLEKADILEMTVRYLRSMKNQNASACMNTADSNAMARYRAGYNECANEVSRYLISLDGLNVQVRARLLSHLASHCSPIIKPASSTSQETPQINQPQSFTAVPMTSPLEAPGLGLPTFGIAKQLDAGTNLLNSAQFQIVPGQLANGKIAAVLLPSQNAPVAMVSAPQLIPVFNKPGGDLQFHVQSSHALRPDNDPLWRPW